MIEDTDIAYPFLSGGGEMGARMRAHDWESTALGSPDTWPQSLRSIVSTCLNSPVLGTVLWGPDFIMLYNDAYIPSMADRHPGALGRPVADVWDSAWDVVSPPFYLCVATGEGFSQRDVELPMMRRGEPETTYWNFSAAPIRGEDGSIVGLFNQGVEITDRVISERKRSHAENELNALNETLEQRVKDRTRDRNDLWELSSDIMLRCGFDGEILSVNPAWFDVLGWSEADLVGQRIFDFIHPADLTNTLEGAQLSAQGRSFTRFDNRYRHKDGSYRWITWSTRPARGVINAVGRDFTLERERLETLKITEEALRQSQKMEAVGQLTGGLAHDFNNLLAGISGSLEMMQARINQGRMEDVSRYMTAAQGAAKRAAALTHRLLAFSRRQTLDPKPVDADRLIRGMEGLVRQSIGPAIALQIIDAHDVWPVLVDSSQLENSLLNLCLNAKDAMPDGGRITIELSNVRLDQDTSKTYDVPEGQYLSISITDTGTGMTPAVMARVYEPFFTTKPIGSGTGLGLSMVYGFARQSGGQVRIRSQVSEGTTVCLYMPRHYGESLSDEGSVNARPILRAEHGKTVVVVDDEPTVRMLVTDILKDMGYAAIQAEDSIAGLKVLQSNVQIDLLVTDVGLPGGMNGRQMAEAARMLRPDLKVLFITGYAEHAVIGEGQLPVGMQVLTKPFAVDTIAARIREIIGS